MLIIYANRLKKIIELIHQIDKKALIVISNVDALKGGITLLGSSLVSKLSIYFYYCLIEQRLL